MALTRKEIEALIRLIGLTRDEEIDCEGCLARIAEFAEHRLVGGSVGEGLVAVERHLAVCAECREEYEVLQRALQTMATRPR